MTYQLYGYAPEPEPVESFDDLEEAAVRCEELVHEDGYDSGEVWDADGDLVYRAGRRPATLARPEPNVLTTPRRGPRGAGPTRTRRYERERPIHVVRDDDRRGMPREDRPLPPREAPKAPAAAPASAPVVPAAPANPAAAAAPPAPSVWVVGDRTTPPVLWFGDSE
jgi:hypothetical protein